MLYIPTVPFRQLISPSNFIGPSQPPTDTILPLLGPHIDTTGIMTSFPNSNTSNTQQQRLLLLPPSVTLPIQHFSDLVDEDRNPLVDEDRHSPMDEDRHYFANELVETLNMAFTGAPPWQTINPLALHDVPNDFDLNNPAMHSESCFIESTPMGLMFLNLDDGRWDGHDSDESLNRRNPRGVLLGYMEIYRDL